MNIVSAIFSPFYVRSLNMVESIADFKIYALSRFEIDELIAE